MKIPQVDVDLLITHGDEAIWVKGRGDSVEIYNEKILFFVRSVRRSIHVTHAQYRVLDEFLNRVGLSVILKTSFISFTIMGVKAKNWVKYLVRYVLPS